VGNDVSVFIFIREFRMKTKITGKLTLTINESCVCVMFITNTLTLFFVLGSLKYSP